jgi:hypothetical protein
VIEYVPRCAGHAGCSWVGEPSPDPATALARVYDHVDAEHPEVDIFGDATKPRGRVSS